MTPPEEVRIDKLSLRGHHLHSPRLLRQVGDRQQVAVLHEVRGLDGQVVDQPRLLARRHIRVFDVVEGGLPVVAVSQFARGREHLSHAPLVLRFGNGDQLLRGVRDHRVVKQGQQFLSSHRIPDNTALIVLVRPPTRPPFFQKRSVVGEHRVGAGVRLLAPPRHVRVVAVVEGVGVFEGLVQILGHRRGPPRVSRGKSLRVL